jgi:hypothetical protein
LAWVDTVVGSKGIEETRRGRSMKAWLLWAVGVLALEVLVVWGYFAVVAGMERISTNAPRVASAALMAVTVVLWISFVCLIWYGSLTLMFPYPATD